MAEYDRQRQERDRYDRQWADRERTENYGRDSEPYRDYGWERGESVLPEFRDPTVHVAPYERERVNRWRNVRWNSDYNYGVVDESGPYRGMGPKGYQRGDDRIFEDVCERLTQHGRIDARDLEVEVKNGEVTLTGFVDSRQTKRMAEQVAEEVQGVKDVHNELHIQDRNKDRESQKGVPGEGRGRVDQVGKSGVFPVSGPLPDKNAPIHDEPSWGQGERGTAGYEDSGSSEIHPLPETHENKPSE